MNSEPIMVEVRATPPAVPRANWAPAPPVSAGIRSMICWDARWSCLSAPNSSMKVGMAALARSCSRPALVVSFFSLRSGSAAAHRLTSDVLPEPTPPQKYTLGRQPIAAPR
jgi:hypothetical protein